MKVTNNQLRTTLGAALVYLNRMYRAKKGFKQVRPSSYMTVNPASNSLVEHQQILETMEASIVNVQRELAPYVKEWGARTNVQPGALLTFKLNLHPTTFSSVIAIPVHTTYQMTGMVEAIWLSAKDKSVVICFSKLSITDPDGVKSNIAGKEDLFLGGKFFRNINYIPDGQSNCVSGFGLMVSADADYTRDHLLTRAL